MLVGGLDERKTVHDFGCGCVVREQRRKNGVDGEPRGPNVFMTLLDRVIDAESMMVSSPVPGSN